MAKVLETYCENCFENFTSETEWDSYFVGEEIWCASCFVNS